ncbi:Photosystem I assembly protein Ycf3 [Candidatus Entotheonellaceae bacterium PAL068K]
MDTTDIERLRQAVQVAPRDAAARLTLLHALVAAEAWEEADDVGTTLLQDASPPATAHVLMGIVYGKRQRWEDAVQQCRQALERQPDDALALFNLGTLLARQGDSDAALECLEKAVAQRQEWAEAHYNLGTVLLRQGRCHEAIEAFDRAVDQNEAYAEAHFNCGNARALQGLDAEGNLDYYELDCATTAYKAAIQHRPGYTAALYNLGMIYKRMNSSEGIRVWEQYLEAAAQDPAEETWRLRAEEYKRDLQDRFR